MLGLRCCFNEVVFYLKLIGFIVFVLIIAGLGKVLRQDVSIEDSYD